MRGWLPLIARSPDMIAGLVPGRGHRFALERAVFVSVQHQRTAVAKRIETYR